MISPNPKRRTVGFLSGFDSEESEKAFWDDLGSIHSNVPEIKNYSENKPLDNQ